MTLEDENAQFKLQISGNCKNHQKSPYIYWEINGATECRNLNRKEGKAFRLLLSSTK